MGAVCGKDKKYKSHVNQPVAVNPPEKQRNVGQDTNLQVIYNPVSVTDPLAKTSPPVNVTSVPMMGKLTTEEDEPVIQKGAATVTGAESNVGLGISKLPSKTRVELPLTDFSNKPNIKSQSHEGIEKNRPVVVNMIGNASLNNYSSIGNVDPVNINVQIVPDNTYEIAFKEKNEDIEDFYLELNEAQMKEYEKFLASAAQSKQKTLKSLNTIGANKTLSHLLEWSKVLQKECIHKDPTNAGPVENENKLVKAYETIIKLDERNWYEEMVLLYKEKIFMSKNTGNMTGLTFDRKIIQLQEQFKWFVSAVANTKLNFNTLNGFYEFPAYRQLSKHRKSDKLDSSGVSVERVHSVVGDNVENDNFLSPKHPLQSGRRSSVLKTQMGGLFGFRGPAFEPRRNFYQELPDSMSAAWQEGFIWKGVFFKLYSKKEGEKLKAEMKALKHLGVEYLQTEATTRIIETFSHSTNNLSEISETGKPIATQIINVLLPLVCTVESSSWILLGTPVFSIKKSVADDQASKVVVETAVSFKSTFLLSGLSPKNFKVYNKGEEPGSAPSYNNTGSAGHHSSYLPGGSNLGNYNHTFLLLTNVSKSLITLPKVNIMFILNQEPNAHVTFLEFPKKKALDAQLIKQMLGYASKDINTSLLSNRKRPPAELKAEITGIYLDSFSFKRRGWIFQVIHIDSKEPLPYGYYKNKRISDLLSSSSTKSKKDIRGNVLVFGYFANQTSIIHPYFISEHFLFSSPEDDIQNTIDPIETPQTMKNGYKDSDLKKPPPPAGPASQMKTSKVNNIDPESFVRDSFLKQSFKQNFLRDEKALTEYFAGSIGKSIEYIVDFLDKTDTIVNNDGLKELFHRKGLNMRFAWVVFMKLQRPRMKALVGADILARCLKNLVDDQTSIKNKYFRKQFSSGLIAQKDKIEELMLEKNEFLMENFSKNLIASYVTVLIRSTLEPSNNNLQVPSSAKDAHNSQELQDEEIVFDEIGTELFLNKMRIYDLAKKIMNNQDFDFFLSAEIIRNITNVACLDSSVFLNAVTYHLKVSINYEILRQFRNDKYNYWVSKAPFQIKATDLNIIHCSSTYLTIYERCYILLLKILSGHPTNMQNSIELVLPAALYKHKRGISYPSDNPHVGGFDCFLKEYYELPDLDVLNDWIVLLESALNGLYTLDDQQNFLTEAYLLQLVLAFFGEGDYDNQLTLAILERVSAFLLTSPVSSPELCVSIYSWFGILLENKLIAECEQNYLRALMILHKVYGDPRGRGGLGTPWELFITWRLSILSRLQSKTHDAEYCEELFDATLVTLKDNPVNSYLKSHYVYSDPFRAYYSSYTKSQPQDELSHLSRIPELNKMELKDHPFSYWTTHLAYSEAISKVDVINSTLKKTPQMLKWMLTHMPIFQKTGIIWNSSNLRDFYFSFQQNAFNNSMSMSSISSYSIDKGANRSILGEERSFTSKSRSRQERKDKLPEQAGNLVQMIEKDSSTFSKKDINGVIYAWGQNNDGQVGTPTGIVEESSIPVHKKMRIFYPKGLIPLKDTVIVSVSCGHTHSLAITLTRHLLAWGSNKSLQLGLGEDAPSRVFVPTLVPGLRDVQSVSCGTEHTIALLVSGAVYSWGQGEGGLLGHGDTDSQALPKKIEGLNGVEVASIVCGGLHTLAVTKQGTCYAWGRAEGGQLGLPFEELMHPVGNNELYLTTPKRIRGNLENVQIIQVACGDAHSLALTEKGQVYGWGYTNNGQLGLGITGDHFDPSAFQTLQVKEPVLITKLSNMKIKEIFAGSTFSLFLNEKKELYACGLNDSSQLGIEKSVTKINNNLENYRQASFNKTTESPVPKLIECFTYMPILNVACGENHSLAKQGQLGIGDIQQQFSTPRPISFLQHIRTYNMACGAYHSLVVLGEASKSFKKESLIDRLERKTQNRWSSISFNLESTYEAMVDQALANLDSIIPSEEGKIDNPKAIKKAT